MSKVTKISVMNLEENVHGSVGVRNLGLPGKSRHHETSSQILLDIIFQALKASLPHFVTQSSGT